MLYLYQLGGGCTCEGLQKAIGLYLRPMGQDAFYSLQITQCLINTVLKSNKQKKTQFSAHFTCSINICCMNEWMAEMSFQNMIVVYFVF